MAEQIGQKVQKWAKTSKFGRKQVEKCENDGVPLLLVSQ